MPRALSHREEKTQAGASGWSPPSQVLCRAEARGSEDPTEGVPLCSLAPHSSQSTVSVCAKLYICWVLSSRLRQSNSRKGKQGVTASVKAAKCCYVREPQHQRLVLVFPHFWWKSMSMDVKVDSSLPRFPPLPLNLSSFKSVFVSSLQSTLPVKY